MSHLTEATLNEYLDGVLERVADLAAEAHLTSCPDCRARLDDLQSVFDNLSLLGEKDLARDLTPSILSNLPSPPLSPVWRLVLAIQVGLSMGLLGTIVQAALIFPWPKVNMHSSTATMIAVVKGISFHLPNISFRTLGLPSYSLPFSAPITVALLVAVTILWLWGNTRLLRNGYEA